MLGTDVREYLGAGLGPAVAGMPVRPRLRLPLDGDEPAARREDAKDLAEARVDVRPVMHGGDAPHDGRTRVGERDLLGPSLEESRISRPRQRTR